MVSNILHGDIRWSTTDDSSGLKDGRDIPTNGKAFYLRVKADLTTGRVKVSISTKAGTYYEARVALVTYIVGKHSASASSQNLGIYRAKKVSVKSQNDSVTIVNPPPKGDDNPPPGRR